MHVAAIWLYPIKSLDGLSVSAATFTSGGSLRHDRAWVIRDRDGDILSAKRLPEMQRVRSSFDATMTTVTFSTEGTAPRTISLSDLSAVAVVLSELLQQPVTLEHDAHVGFPDDLDSPGPTIISSATLAACASWFPGITAEEMRARLRPNIILAACAPFAEDAFYGADGERRQLRIGDVTLWGNNPCQRCAVPTRHPQTGETLPLFQKTFSGMREASLPEFVARERFTHFYRAAVNTVVSASEAGKVISVGEQVAIG